MDIDGLGLHTELNSIFFGGSQVRNSKNVKPELAWTVGGKMYFYRILRADPARDKEPLSVVRSGQFQHEVPGYLSTHNSFAVSI